MLDVPVHEQQVAERRACECVHTALSALNDLKLEPRVQWASYITEATITHRIYFCVKNTISNGWKGTLVLILRRKRRAGISFTVGILRINLISTSRAQTASVHCSKIR